MTIVLIDLSSIAHPIWHMSQSDPNPNAASESIVARVRGLATGQPHVAICCDKGKSFRHEVTLTYKANRPEHEAMLHHQIALAIETLRADGFPIWAVPGFEADDLIATATAKAQEIPADVRIVSADKDLLQLVGPTVVAQSLKTNATMGAEEVVAKFGVKPAQMRDWLTLVGDKSDNIQGVKGIGDVRAASLLVKFGTLDAIYGAIVDKQTDGLTPSMVENLTAFYPNLDMTRELITLRTDAEIPFAEVLTERVIPNLPPLKDPMADQIDEAMPTVTDTPTALAPVPQSAALAQTQSRPADVFPAPAEWERQLEPRSMSDVIQLAKYVHESRLFSAYGTPQAVLTTLLAGRELGMQAMASLRGLHIVEGRPTMAADLMHALVLRSGVAKFFRMTARTEDLSTWETQRGDDPPVSVTYTMDEARQAGVVKEKSGWMKYPADMLVARASSKLARLVYPDVLHGIYTPDEIEENRR